MDTYIFAEFLILNIVANAYWFSKKKRVNKVMWMFLFIVIWNKSLFDCELAKEFCLKTAKVLGYGITN